MRSHKSLLSFPIAVLLIILLSGCASIPSEAPELSGELGRRISAIEKANINLLHRFFDLKRDEVDRFIQEEWTPEFAENFFSDPKMKSAWNTIVSENDAAQRLQFLIHTGPKLQAMINKKRLEMIRPLDELERGIENKMRSEYTQARSINNTITSFLASASKVAENRQRYLDMVGVSDEDVNNIIDGVGDTVSSLLQTGENVRDKIEKVEDYLKKLKELKDQLKQGD